MTENHQVPSSSIVSAAKRALGALGARRTQEEWRTVVSTISGSELFDREYYLQTYPDVAAAGIDPVEHYVRFGAEEGRDPGPNFRTRYYLDSNPDVAASGQNPLKHYLEYGRAEGRSTMPDPHTRSSATKESRSDGATRVRSAEGRQEKVATTPAYRLIAGSGTLDKAYYSAAYPGVARRGVDPIAHFIQVGALEFKNPNEFFDTSYYLKKYPDVERSGINPLVHYQRYGWRELRNPGPNFDTAWYWLIHMRGALHSGSPLQHFLSIGRNLGLATRPDGMSTREKRRISAAVAKVLDAVDLQKKLGENLARYLAQNGIWDAAELVCRRMVASAWNDARNHERLAEVLAAQNKRWQEVESLKVAIALDHDNVELCCRLGNAYAAMERWVDSAQAFRRALEIQPAHWEAHYGLGYALEQCGDPGATLSYASAVELSGDPDIQRFDVGAIHERHRRWDEAAAAYAKKSLGEPLDAQLQFRVGKSQQRCYRWKEAEQAFQIAIALDPSVADWHYRLGFVRERSGDFWGAAAAYERAVELHGAKRPYWRYRLGYVLSLAGEYERACKAFLDIDESGVARTIASVDSERLQGVAADPESMLDRISRALEMDTTRADWHFALGMHHERTGAWEEASNAYRAAVDRSDDHRPSWYFRLGLVLYRLGQYRAASEALCETRVVRTPFGVDSTWMEKDPSEMVLLSYRQYVDHLPLRARTILYESYAGVSVGCNPRAIFEWMYAAPEYAGWTHVWVVANRSAIPKAYRRMKNVIFVTRESDLYLRYLATASHLVNNSTFPPYFFRRDGQRYLNTWHGTPLKTLGKDIKGNFMERKNTARNFLQATHIISPNAHTTRVLVDRYDLSGLISGRVSETGYPRVDAMLGADEDSRRRVLDQLGLTEGVPVVLYAPTWRGNLGSPVLDLDTLREVVGALAGLQCQVVFRGHYFSEKLLEGVDLPVTVAPQSIDTSMLLSVTDVLVTDYSSILFDFLPLRRPIVYFVPDKEQYMAERGLYFPLGEMPGDLCESVGSMGAAVSKALAQGAVDQEGYDRAIATFCPFEDGHAAERVVNFFMGPAQATISTSRDSRPSLLFYAGAFPPNGITTSFLNLIMALDPSHYRVTIVIDPDAIERDRERMERFSRLPSWVQVVGRVGRMLSDPEERWLSSRLRTSHSLNSQEMWDRYLESHAREFRRMFGSAKFDAVVHFDGYSSFWSATLIGAGSGVGKIIFLHNDMRGEMELKFPYLRSMFRMYRDYDALVSVSATMSEINRLRLATPFAVPSDKFTFAENMIDHKRILEGASQPLDADLANWMRGHTVFMTIGRMSPEKDHVKLIHAFREVAKQKPNARLLVLGDGPLRGELEKLIEDLGLQGRVLLAGLRENPFPALAACDCFILSSNHEGQPMVLLEALVLSKPIIATDIDGSRGALADRGGMLVGNSVQGLVKGMLAFMAGEISPKAFDADAYRVAALGQFHRAVSRAIRCQESHLRRS